MRRSRRVDLLSHGAMAMNAAGMGVEPAMLCCLPEGERGCKLILFGRTHPVQRLRARAQ